MNFKKAIHRGKNPQVLNLKFAVNIRNGMVNEITGKPQNMSGHKSQSNMPWR